MDNTTFNKLSAATYDRKLRELASDLADLADLVESGDITDTQANEWMVAKQEQWRGEGF